MNYTRHASLSQASQVQDNAAPARPASDVTMPPFYLDGSMPRTQGGAPANVQQAREAKVDVANHSRDRADLLLSRPKCPRQPPPPKSPETKVNEANHSNDRADLLLTLPKRLPNPPPPSQCDPQSGDPQAPETSGPSEEKPDSIVKRLVKKVLKAFTNRQQGPPSREGPVGLTDYPRDSDFC